MTAFSRPGVARKTDWDEVSQSVADAYFPHELSVRDGSGEASLSLRHVDVGRMTIAKIGWGADVSLVSSHPGAYGINVPRCGYLEAQVGGREVTSVDGLATICPPDTVTRLTRWTRDCTIIGIKIEREFLEREVLTLTSQPTARIPDQLDLRTPEGRNWIDLVTSMATQALSTPAMVANPKVADHIARAVASAFAFAAFPQRDDNAAPARPRIVSKVIDAIEANPGDAWTASNMAQVAGIGIRRLQLGFHDYLGQTPSQVLLSIRLETAHRELLGSPQASVAEIAWSSGFTHLGRFAAAYKERFGYSPSVTHAS